MLEVENRFGRDNMDGNPVPDSRYSGGVVGSDWYPADGLTRLSASAICWISFASCCCRRSIMAISASNRWRWLRRFSYSWRFFSSCFIVLVNMQATKGRVGGNSTN